MKPLRDVGTRQTRTMIRGEDHDRVLAEAKSVARHLITEFAKVDCSLAVMGTALAILLGVVAHRVRFEAKENFYQDFLLAARESEAECARVYASFEVAH